MCMYLRFVCTYAHHVNFSISSLLSGSLQRSFRSRRTCAHDPLSILTDPYALAGFLELEILEQFDAAGVLGVGLEAAFSLSGQPFRKWARGGRA